MKNIILNFCTIVLNFTTRSIFHPICQLNNIHIYTKISREKYNFKLLCNCLYCNIFIQFTNYIHVYTKIAHVFMGLGYFMI